MKATRIEISAYTASFRVPGIAGYQVTARVPPPSTVYGLIAAAAGREVTPEETWVAYRFGYSAAAVDLETIITFGAGGPAWEPKQGAVRSAPVSRQFLYQPRLVLYVASGPLAESFARPAYPPLLGRSQDVANIEAIRDAELVPAGADARVCGVLLPFPTERLPASHIMSFPTFYPVHGRTPRAVRPFHVLDSARGRQTAGSASRLYVDPDDDAELAIPIMTPDLL